MKQRKGLSYLAGQITAQFTIGKVWYLLLQFLDIQKKENFWNDELKKNLFNDHQ